MLAVIRIILASILSVSICILGIIYCILRPRHPNNTAFLGRLFGSMAPIFGITVEIRNLLKDKLPKNCIYISNHQNNYDMVTVSCIVPPRTITVGKKNLLWIPLFGQLYWLCGNILINRSRRFTAYNTVLKIVRSIKVDNISLWVFPEGKRSFNKGLLPFKTSIFHAAISNKIPIVPICVSNLNNKVKLNRWSNGVVIIEIMPPIDTAGYNLSQVRYVTKYCYMIMKNRIDSLSKESLQREDHNLVN
ncbi:1-acylglycerol-3-phosphate O-acyltransferase [Candidatus Blochmannia ocreatus (nom. nud.)]|uniref:1-acyl-sn-glycerol-3-phosphate acyltransferase n=1 Tax=Candidatus Blochmannia ocreatus (nom. nud.) TaxID=251538 RepID=A0ABY4ST49_9ENTR|nr:1-acylglycerol-3-phosphate O-acyltransferase [Candidatus Blochmannia ocreatus]URJ25154.1 1-acylglycerol-3-phosphate O-acyltransferase [Candidatus Blochmannia ocreatus]